MTARTSILAIGVAVGLAAGCSDDTGILVEVHGERLELAVARLDTMVILDDGSAVPPDHAAWGGADNRQDTVTGVDLRVEPYTVLLRPDGVETDATLWVAAVAYDGTGEVIGFGQMPSMLAFQPDVVLRVQLDLAPASRFDAGDGHCVVSGGVIVVRTSDDCDGDAVAYPEDCDDLDPAVVSDLDDDPAICQDDCDVTNGDIYPGNAEVCDGLDNDCDESTYAAPELCAVVTMEAETVTSCRIGQRDCLDVNPEAPFDDLCRAVTLDPTANSGVCAGWAECINSGATDCLVQTQIVCKTKVSDAGACTESAVDLRTLAPDADQCAYRLIGGTLNGGWNVGLRADGVDQLVSFFDGCAVELVVASSPALALPKLLVLEVVLDDVHQVVSVLLDPKRDGCQPGDDLPLECAILEGGL